MNKNRPSLKHSLSQFTFYAPALNRISQICCFPAALSQFSKIVPIKTASLRYAVCGCCLCIKNANYYNSCLAIKRLFLPESSLDESPISHGQKHGGGALLPVKNKRARKRCFLTRFSMPVVGVEPTRVISTRDFEFLSSSSIWCHPVIFSDIWFPLCKGKIHASTNNNLEYPRFFDAFSPYSVFSVWTAQKEIGGMFRRDAGQNAPLLRHKTKGKSRIMNQNQAKEYYKKLFVNYPDVLSVEEATTLLGFKSQTAIIRRIHKHRIRCLKVGRSFMIPKEYLIDYLLDS